MSWSYDCYDIIMCQGDYGVAFPISLPDATFGALDEIRLVIKTAMNGRVVLRKIFSNIQNNKVDLELTAEESALLPVGQYVYCLDWYQNNVMMCNVIPCAGFTVTEKAGDIE